MRSHTMGGKGGAGSPYDAAPASPKARYDWQLSGGYKDGASDADGGGGGGYRGQFGQRAGGGAWEEPRHGYDGGARDRERDRDREGFPRNDYGAPRGDRPGGFTRPPTFEERELMRQQSDGPAGTGPRDPRTGPHQEQHYHRQGSWNAPGGGQHGPEKHSRGGGPPGGPRQFWNQGRGWGGGAR